MFKGTGLFLILAWVTLGAVAGEEPPTEWIDPSTGHRVVRLSRESGSSSFYFHQNAYTAAGNKMVFSTSEGLATINLKTREIEPLVDLAKHNYKLEPNVSFTPDGKWIVFRSNMHGPTHVYAVEVKRN